MSSNEDRTCPVCGTVDKGMAYGMSGNPFSSWYRLCDKCKTAFFYTGQFVHFRPAKPHKFSKDYFNYDEGWITKTREELGLIKVALD